MKKTDYIILSLFLLLGVIAAFMPNAKPHNVILDSHTFLYKLSSEHFYTTDDVAKAIINKDPSLLLIDVRSPEEYKKYTLPGAINIPVDSLLLDKYRNYVDQDVYNVVLFSNGTELAEKAWVMCTGLGYDHLYVMRGGLNRWFTTIFMPPKPKDEAHQSAFELYNFRKAAARYFGIGGTIEQPQSSAPAVQPQVNIPKTSGAPEGGGCE